MRKAIEAIVCQAGDALTRATDIGVREKSGHTDLVTQYDLQTQAFLKENLLALLPQAHFIGEESDRKEPWNQGWCFIVDPIDGTTNFIRDFHHSCVSVGLLKDGVPEIGVVYNPYLKECFSAQRGQGATLNGKPIHVTDNRLYDSLVCFGTMPYAPELAEPTMKLALCVLQHSMDLRRCGSAALDLCYVACGRSDLYFEWRISPWDWAAGRLMVTEAGGRFCNLDGAAVDERAPSSVLAGGQHAVDDFLLLRQQENV